MVVHTFSFPGGQVEIILNQDSAPVAAVKQRIVELVERQYTTVDPPEELDLQIAEAVSDLQVLQAGK